ncbi:TadE/TadG family type IV pilus assembly protein [Blastococcus sp. PRF04-17]|uniref:TadE/TadG family type IV pilus assembly protein n=1 Tax=Blastococcus sp. PRF04-17 TaxID=2933797 RepID=UPI001FF30D12|nr:Tad domain-containing protein [Blastococcus sp. PRF04-17]UOY00016.1 Tad domain-containing protein [Blastococcus sp. PRF04-17]
MSLRQWDAERGSIAVFVAVLVPGLLLIIGLAVDGGAKVAATQRANAVADEAARAGGQALDVSAALAGQVRVEPIAAVAAAQNYLDRNGVEGQVSVVDGDTLQVTTRISQPTIFLGLIGISTFTVEGIGTAELVTDDQNGGAGP